MVIKLKTGSKDHLKMFWDLKPLERGQLDLPFVFDSTKIISSLRGQLTTIYMLVLSLKVWYLYEFNSFSAHIVNGSHRQLGLEQVKDNLCLPVHVGGKTNQWHDWETKTKEFIFSGDSGEKYTDLCFSFPLKRREVETAIRIHDPQIAMRLNGWTKKVMDKLPDDNHGDGYPHSYSSMVSAIDLNQGHCFSVKFHKQKN